MMTYPIGGGGGGGGRMNAGCSSYFLWFEIERNPILGVVQNFHHFWGLAKSKLSFEQGNESSKVIF